MECNELRAAYATAGARVEATQTAHEACKAYDLLDYDETHGGEAWVATAGLLAAAKIARAQVALKAAALDWSIVHMNDGHLPCLSANTCQVEDKIDLPMPDGWAAQNVGTLLSDGD